MLKKQIHSFGFTIIRKIEEGTFDYLFIVEKEEEEVYIIRKCSVCRETTRSFSIVAISSFEES